MNLSKLRQILRQMLLLPVLALLLAALILIAVILAAFRTVGRMQVADRNIETTTRIGALLIDEETGLRGYQTTGDQVFLEPYREAGPQLPRALARLRSGLAEEQSADAGIPDRLAAAHADWLKLTAEPLIAATRQGSPAARDTAVNLQGKARMDNMRAQLAALLAQERQHRADAAAAWNRASRDAIVAVVALCVLLGFILGLFSREQLNAVSSAFGQSLESLQQNARAIKDSEQRLRTVLTSIGDGVVVTDTEGNIEMLNTVAQHLCGWSQAEAAGKPLAQVLFLVDELTRAPMETPVVTVMRERRIVPRQNHAVLVRRDGKELHIDDSGAPIWDADGNLTGVVMVFRDVSEHRRTQTSLLASEKLAVTGRMAATIAHEIHNPLDAVINLLYLLRTDPTPEERAHFLDLASSELDRVAHISRAMLGMYRESKTPIAIDFNDLLESVLLLFDRNFTTGRITLVKRIEPGLQITGYPGELRQAFSNFIANSLDASEPGCTLTVVAEKSAPQAIPGVTVTLSDTGCGIPQETLDRLFQPFFTTKGEHGTGLGLWVSRGIIEKHGGGIQVASRTGEAEHGTTIRVFLPDAPPLHSA